jgi:hypothetical protein
MPRGYQCADEKPGLRLTELGPRQARAADRVSALAIVRVRRPAKLLRERVIVDLVVRCPAAAPVHGGVGFVFGLVL